MTRLLLVALLAIGCSNPVDTCECGNYVVEATQLDGKCGPVNARKTWLDCSIREATGTYDYVAPSGPLVLKWEDWYDLDGLVGGSTMVKVHPEPAMAGETGTWGTADATFGYDEPLCTSRYDLKLTKLE